MATATQITAPDRVNPKTKAKISNHETGGWQCYVCDQMQQRVLYYGETPTHAKESGVGFICERCLFNMVRNGKLMLLNEATYKVLKAKAPVCGVEDCEEPAAFCEEHAEGGEDEAEVNEHTGSVTVEGMEFSWS